MKIKALTKAQLKTAERLVARGYDHRYTQPDGKPVMMRRDTRNWVEVNRDGSYRPASSIHNEL